MSKVIKICPTDPKKLLNPETGRCVIESNRTIKKLLGEGWTIVVTGNRNQPEPSGPSSSDIKIIRICPIDPNKIVNPETGRCVNHNNPIIKKLIREGWTMAINNSRKLPVLVKNYGNLTNWKKLKSYLDKNKDSIVSIDEYLGKTEITGQEEEESVGEFENLYRTANLIIFLRKESVNNPIINRSICLADTRVVLGFEPRSPRLPKYSVITHVDSSDDYRYVYILSNAYVFNTSITTDTRKRKPKPEIIMPSLLPNLLQTCTKRYLILPLTITDMDMYQYFGLRDRFFKGAHANVLIFDTKNKIIERFDPHGSRFYSDAFLSKDMKRKNTNVNPHYNQETLDGELRSYFRTIVPDYLFKDILYSCPYLGPQQKADVGDGYCVTWVTMYTFLRLLNPDIPPGTINKLLLNDKSDNIKTTLKRFAKYYSDVIKS